MAGPDVGAFILKIPEPAANFFHSGYVAVGCFFALSGFVLAYNYRLGAFWTENGIERFLAARFARIYPIYLLGLLLLIPYALVDLCHSSSGWAWQAKTLAANMLLIQSWKPTIAISWNFPGWSLSDEMFFYLCFPVAGVLVWRATNGARRTAICGILLFAA